MVAFYVAACVANMSAQPQSEAETMYVKVPTVPVKALRETNVGVTQD